MLITQDKIIDLAFSKVDQITTDAIKSTKIEAAELKYIAPALGRLYGELCKGRYEELVEGYIAPALAYFVRYEIIPDLSLKVGNAGTQMAFTDNTAAATDAQRNAARQSAKDSAEVLLQAAVDYLNNNKALYPEFDGAAAKRPTYSNGGLIFRTR